MTILVDGRRRKHWLARVAAVLCLLSVAHTPALGDPPEQGSMRRERIRNGLRVVPGVSPVSGPGPVRRFIIEVHVKVAINDAKFAEDVETILYDDRSWGGGGRLGMKRVDSGDVAFRVTLARPRKVDKLCAPLQTNGRYSCFNGYRAVINSRRWKRGAASYDWGRYLRAYRRYLINHEVGHALGHHHRYCGRAGAPAPVMMQQTKGVAPCRRNPWPLRYERNATRSSAAAVRSL